jgi:hypothetical protein
VQPLIRGVVGAPAFSVGIRAYEMKLVLNKNAGSRYSKPTAGAQRIHQVAFLSFSGIASCAFWPLP